MQHIGIIGGGFSGSMTAVNLSRLSAGPLKITLINSGFPLGRGIAYSTHNGNHLLNVAARNMSALADQPNHFVEWLGTRDEYRDEPAARLREKFMPRRLYGDYLHGLLFGQACAAEKGCIIEMVAAEAIDLIPNGKGASIELSDGRSIAVDKVVLATGNAPPSRLRVPGLDPAHPRYFQNPWEGWERKLVDRTENVVVVGTGLTAVDAFISLSDLAWKGKIYAVSRNGLLPLRHFKGSEFPDWLDAKSGRISLSDAFRAFKLRMREARQKGVNPAVLVDKLRPVTQLLWRNFTLAERSRFNRHLRTRWNVARHRIAQSIQQQLAEAIAANHFEVIKGRLCAVVESGGQLVVQVRTAHGLLNLEAGALINCTGPSEACAHSTSLLYRNLQSRGLIAPDEMDMGIRVNADFAVLNKLDEESPFLSVLGPALKGTLWETSAVPELRHQAFRVAEVLAGQLFGRRAKDLAESAEIVHEYEI